MTNAEQFRAKLIEMVKASGQEIIDRAEDLVGSGDLITDFDICIHLPCDGYIPTIEVTRSHLSKRCVDVLGELAEHDNADTENKGGDLP